MILTPLFQADAELKYRPAIVLREMPLSYKDLLVCGISTQLNQNIPGFDEIISPADVDLDFASSGLHSESLIRLGFLGVVPRRLGRGTLGTISKERHIRLLQKLASYLTN